MAGRSRSRRFLHRAHLDRRLSAPYRLKGPYTTVHPLDYGQAEVRAYFMALIREIVTEYKPDALELDFMR